LSKIACDFVGPYVETPEGYKYVLQIQDILSRYVMFVPTKDATAASAAKALIERWVCVFDIPSHIQSDNGTHFASTLLHTICEQLGIKQVFSSPWHPESQGQVERQNDTLNNCLTTLVGENPDSWPTLLPMVAYAVNSGPAPATQLSPMELLFKQEPNRPEAFLLPRENQTDEEEYKPGGPTPQEKLAKSVKVTTKKWEKVYQRTRKRIKEAQTRQAKRTEKQVYHKKYNLNDLVMKKNHAKDKGKLCNYFCGPYVVVGQPGPVTYRIREAGNAKAKEELRHYNELLPWTVQRLRNETNAIEDDIDSLPEVQSAQPPRRSTRMRKQTEFIQLGPDHQVYQYRPPTGQEEIIDENDNVNRT
jgi:hypothetical protein